MKIAYINKNNLRDLFIKNSKSKIKDFEIVNIVKLWKKIIEE
jgi:hypothetical protein